MEDLVCRYDGTVRNSTGDVLQFLYGEDGMNAQMLEEQTIDLLTMTDADTAHRVRAWTHTHTHTHTHAHAHTAHMPY
jgi:hypothetical protein